MPVRLLSFTLNALMLAQVDGDESIEPHPGHSLDGLQAGIDIFVWVALAGMAAFGIYLFYKRGTTMLQSFDAEESAFEASARREFRAPITLGRIAPMEAELLAGPTNGDADHSPSPSSPPLRPPVEGGATAHPTGPLFERDLPPMAYSVVSRLRAGNLLNSVEGPARTTREDLTATVLNLRSGKRIVVVETIIGRDDPATEGLLRFYDGLIAPGPGPDPIFIRRFESFVGDMFSM